MARTQRRPDRRPRRRDDRSTPVELVTLRPTGFAAGGGAIARDDEGRVVFVEGALPGEEVRARVTQRRTDFARATVAEVVAAVPARVVASCAGVASGCGACDWAHVDHREQPGYKASIVVDALRRLGGIARASELVSAGPDLPGAGFRTTLRAAVRDGRAGLRAQRSHDVVPVPECRVAHPVVEAALLRGSFPGVREVTIRFAPGSGDLVVVCDPVAATSDPGVVAGEVLGGVGVRSVRVVSVDVGLDASSPGEALAEVVRSTPLQVSAGSFFQTNSDGALALVDVVERLLGEGGAGVGGVNGRNEGSSVLFDLYGGVGLFAAALGARFTSVVAVEANRSAANDCEHNLRGLPDARSVRMDVDRWRPSREELTLWRGALRAVVADPPRAGLGRGGVATLQVLDPEVVVLISCDAASLGRDVRLLHDAGYELRRSVVVDLFPDTSHVEVASLLVRAAAQRGDDSRR